MLALTAIASLPFFSVVPARSDDGLLHLYRVVELDHCLALGRLFPRWMPDLAQGYGFPLLNFYPPLAYYVTEAFHLLGASLSRSFSLTFLLAGVLSGVGMYLLAKDMAGARAGALAALLYVYAPAQLTNAIHRGAFAEVLAWAQAPWVLWAFRRLALSGRARWLLAASLSYAALLLTHHLSALTFSPLLVLLVTGTWLGRRCTRNLVYLLAAVALAFGLSASFTVPALRDRSLVQIDRVFSLAGYDYRQNYITLRDLLAGPVRADPSRMNPDRPRSIGWIQIGMGFLGCVGAATARQARKRSLYLGALVAACSLFIMMQSWSLPVWEKLGPLRYLQFPWRLLSPLSLVLAFMGSGIGFLLPDRPGRAWGDVAVIGAVAVSLFVYETPLLYPRRYPLPSANPTVADLLRFERGAGVLGLTSGGDYLPVGVQEVPLDSPMAAQYEAGSPVTWLDAGSLPPGAQVQRAAYGLDRMEVVFDSPVPFHALINQYYFPGWRAYVDGAPSAIGTVAPHGLIAVEMPAGMHTLRLCFGETPLRQAADLVSLFSAFGLAGMAWLVWRNGKAIVPAEPAIPGAALPVWCSVVLIALSAGYTGLKIGVLDRYDSFLKASRLHGNQVQGAQTNTQTNFGRDMMLLGYDLPARSVAAGGKLRLRLYWKALRPLAAEYSTGLHLVDAVGHSWGQKDSWHPGGYPTGRWEVDAYDLDSHDLEVLLGTPPGEYALRLTVYDPRSGKELDVLDQDGRPVGTSTLLDRVQVVRPAAPPSVAVLGIQETFSVRLSDDVELLGGNVPRDPVRPGQRVGFTLFWRAIRRPQADYQALIRLGDAQLTAFFPLAGQPYPTSSWQQGEIVRAQYDIVIPAETPPGANALHVALADSAGSPGRSVAIGQLDVLPISRRMEVPAMENRVDASLGDRITLLGYDLDSREVERGESLHLRLYWQARQPLAQEYKVFTHLLDAQDRISAQQDGVPAQGSRPTTSWIAGEVIVDDYTLTVRQDAPVGEHRLEIGIYDQVSGQRLAVRDRHGEPQGDRLLLGAVEVR